MHIPLMLFRTPFPPANTKTDKFSACNPSAELTGSAPSSQPISLQHIPAGETPRQNTLDLN